MYRQILIGNMGRDPGTFSGSYSGEIIEWKKLGILPLGDGETRKFRGYGLVRLGEFQFNGDELGFRVSSVARIQRSGTRAGHSFPTSASLFAILRHTGTGTLISPEDGSSRNSGGLNLAIQSEEFQIQKQSLHTALGHTPTVTDLAEFELDLYALTPVGSVAGTFRKDNWVPFSSRPGDVNDPAVPTEAWTKAVLPDDPTDDQVDTYLDTIIHGLPRDIRHDDQKLLQAKFNALGSTHLDRLIALLPVHHQVRHYIANTIRQHVTRDHLPVLLAAFERDPRLAVIFIQKRWQQDAIAIARNHLRSKAPFYSGDAVYLVDIATTTADPALNDDLFRHFVLAGGGHSNMINNLRNQPGFPLEEAIAKAWNRERAGLASDTRDLAYHAIRLGDPEALRQAIAHFSGLTNPDDRNYDDERELLDAGIDQPAGTDALAWAHAHFARLRFDPDRHVFVLPD